MLNEVLITESCVVSNIKGEKYGNDGGSGEGAYVLLSHWLGSELSIMKQSASVDELTFSKRKTKYL